ncbi:MAG: 3-keto-5-aminohexanoate cleavage protein [Actinobacteria bacterium]|jgi:3-keto-5-aminohexanoate cleavage enzyme|nr:MAG: 3-keto-5-aminohexanoate cleavage protein [Actinomycetota bacterium]
MNMDEYLWDWKNFYLWLQKVREGMPPLIISVAITGGMHGKEANENLPETPEEQAQQTYEAYKEGACIVHVHARNPDAWFLTSSDPEHYRRVNTLIREKCPDIIINNTTGGGPHLTQEQRMASVYAGPELCSLNLGPMALKMKLKERPEPLPSPRPELPLEMCLPIDFNEVATYAKAMKDNGIKPEMELYHSGQYWVVQDLIMQGLIEPPYDIQFVMGMQTGAFPTPPNLFALINELPPQSLFFVIGIGYYQLPMNTISILLGGHVRVGLEDNVYFSKGRKMQSNAEAVARIARIARELNREVATPAQAREMLGISQEPSQY